MMPDGLSIKDCEHLEAPELDALRCLKVSDEQLDFGGSFEETLAVRSDVPSESGRVLCFVLDRIPVGIVALKRPPYSPDWVSKSAVSMHGLKIAGRFQGQGLGKQAFRLAVTRASALWPDAETLVLSVDAANTVALSVYRGLGMSDSGPVFPGRVGMEHRLEIGLGPPISLGAAD